MWGEDDGFYRELNKLKALLVKFYSTEEICQIYGLQFNPFVTNFLIDNEYVFLSDNSVYYLTELGSQYGKIDLHNDNQRKIVWNEEKFAPILQNLKKDVIKNHKNRFKLYHMTHIDNLKSICEIGYLLSHNQIKDYIDISNQSVNTRRSVQEPFYNKSIHDYVPLYFNPRNAMLNTVQRKFGNEIIIFEINLDICLNPYTLFTYKNAATNDALFFNDVIEFLDDADWSSINRYTWFDDPTGITKKAMMSECLVFDKIPINFINCIKCITEEIANKIIYVLDNNSDMSLTVYYNSNLFFKI